MTKSEAWKAYEKGREKGMEIVDRLSDEGLTYTEAGRALRFAQEELNRRRNEETESKVVAGGTANTEAELLHGILVEIKSNSGQGFKQTINVGQLSAEDVRRELKNANVAEKETGLYEKAQKFAENIMDRSVTSPDDVAVLTQLLEVLLQYSGAGEVKSGKG